ncbi:ornithine cyclodeaminase/alanine dehydrogenase [Rhodopseudomonas julia]|uniref:Ornithine cyclodeaminase/alanine dehydrogenase n=1 Tax=Rhodopseudomonas julia TaxID=200617 RepID=A0ABU0C3Y6_9BRAD|nr:ornithine cyclodeaminase family protein [Rhodopseudomonas julia]MDQ0324651.1 ornithine cyclodeaminase/alanine dehydrogenase [Rhodopseudomonas julia]
MNDAPPFLSEADIKALAIAPDEARRAVVDTFWAAGEGRAVRAPKTALTLSPGHGFQAMAAASASAGIAVVKWIGIATVPPGGEGPGINSLIIVNDYETGKPVAVLDGNEITLIRTAALSAVAGSYLAPTDAYTLGMIGCGLQAHQHLEAFCEIRPGLNRLLAFSRSEASAVRLAEAAEARGLAGEVVSSPQDLLERADIVVSMVPASPELTPFLDARLLKRDCFVAAVDLGRAWLPESFGAFDVMATDDLAQGTHPWDANGCEVDTAEFATDLLAMCRETASQEATSSETRGRRLFCFKGSSLADLALSALAVERAWPGIIARHARIAEASKGT